MARRLARATQRVAIVLLADQFPSALPEKPLRPTVSVRAPWEIISDKLIVYRFDFLLRRGAPVPLGVAGARTTRWVAIS